MAGLTRFFARETFDPAVFDCNTWGDVTPPTPPWADVPASGGVWTVVPPTSGTWNLGEAP